MAQKEIICHDTAYRIAYETVRPSASETLLFLHGWGSNKEVMKQAFAKRFPGYRLLFVDLPGFGKSPNDASVLTTEAYAEIVRTFLKRLSIEPVAIFGHSFGGKVATLLDPPLLVLLSSAGIVVPKPLSVRMKIALFKLLKPLGGRRLLGLFASRDVHGMPPHMYETFKNVVDEDFSDRFAAFPRRALLFWGRSDTATPLWTGERIAALLPDGKLFPLEGDHYFFLQHAPFIEQETLKALDART